MLTKDELLAVKEGDFIQETAMSLRGQLIPGDITVKKVVAVYLVDRDSTGRVIAEVSLQDEEENAEDVKLREGNVKFKVIPTATKGRKPKASSTSRAAE